ncbi:MAG: transporter substrate-binding domain-containing protein [Ruminococcaceae bacterium]|nr:transporter substrate-binding domain-containing protein [Oscillospiraceae bacterium]
MKKFLAIALAAIMLFALAACGGSGEKEAAVKLIDIQLSSEEYAFGVDKAQPELLEKTNAFIEKILKDGTFDEICNKYLGDGTPEGVASAEKDATKDQLIVATNAEFAPFEYLEGDLYYGIDMEVAALLAAELGKELVIDNMDFDAVCLAVGQHKCDIAIAGLSINPDREESVTFTTPYYKSAQKIIVKADDTRFDACETAEDIEAVLAALPEGTKIGAQTGTTGQSYIEGNDAFGFVKIENAQAVTYDSAALATQDLVNGNVDFVIVDADPAVSIVETING